ncbi:MAG TPA: deoxynucleoside kinase, partial [Flavobacteriaceae bacterium]|nr:deoxynucleoside kinase [Flavobacteriaceae bacterium]
DYDIYKSMIFARVTLNAEEISLYKRLFHIMYKDIPKPDLYIYLYQHTDRLLKNIKKRGRSYEQNIPADYLENINRGYLDFIKSQNHLQTKIIDVTDLDFISNREDYLFLLREILSA